MIGDHLQQYTYDYLMRLALSLIPDDRDKRQGSIIYDALAPFCQVLAAGAMELRNYYIQTNATTATGESLDERASEQGVTRYLATNAIKKVSFADADGNPVRVPVGARFSTVSDTNPINYTVTAEYRENDIVVPGSYEATCEEAGVVGNGYSGNLINITFIQGLASAYMSTTLVPAREEETDEELRERYFEALDQKAFGGNIADYREKIRDIQGVGDVQIYPTWNGGGTVKVSIIDPTYGPCSPEFISAVQEQIDPENHHGEGLGIAPIGHFVTVDTPNEVDIDIGLILTLRQNYSIEQVRPLIQDALTEYIQTVRREWANADDKNNYACYVFVSQVSARVLSVVGVANVREVTLNGLTEDIILTETGAVQELPKLREVAISV